LRKIEIANLHKPAVIPVRQLIQRLVPMRAVRYLFLEID
jgi:hypothetical protein